MTLKSIASLCVLLRKPSSVPHKLWHAFIGHSLGRLLCLAPEEFEKSGSGPWPKKVVHHCPTWFRTRVNSASIGLHRRLVAALHKFRGFLLIAIPHMTSKISLAVEKSSL